MMENRKCSNCKLWEWHGGYSDYGKCNAVNETMGDRINVIASGAVLMNKNHCCSSHTETPKSTFFNKILKSLGRFN